MDIDTRRKKRLISWHSRYGYALGLIRFGRIAVPVSYFLIVYGVLFFWAFIVGISSDFAVGGEPFSGSGWDFWLWVVVAGSPVVAGFIIAGIWFLLRGVVDGIKTATRRMED